MRVRVCVFKRSDMNKSGSVCVSLIYTLSTKSPFRLPPVYSCYLGADGTCHTHKSRRGLRELAPRGWMQSGYEESSFSFFGTPFLHLSQFTLRGELKSTVHQRTSVNQCAKALSSTVGFVFCGGFTINVCSRA